MIFSRVGKLPIAIPEKDFFYEKNNSSISMKGLKGALSLDLNKLVCKLNGKFDDFFSVSLDVNKRELKVEVKDLENEKDDKQLKSVHGLCRAFLANMVTGVAVGFEIKLELVGVGYRASSRGRILDLSLGFSHNIMVLCPKEITVETGTEKGKNPFILIKSSDKELLGNFASIIRNLRPPEPYKGKGIRMEGEEIIRKAGKGGKK